MDFNIALIEKILLLIEADVSLIPKENADEVFSDLIIAKQKHKIENPQYHQVFHSKHGFINNLSVLDLLFNLGPQSLEYLKRIKY